MVFSLLDFYLWGYSSTPGDFRIFTNNHLSFKGGTGGGPSTTREEKIKTIVDDIMEKLPDPFSMSEIMGKVEERTPYVVVAFQVITGPPERMRT